MEVAMPAGSEVSPEQSSVKTEPAWRAGEWEATSTGSNMRDNYSQPFGVVVKHRILVVGTFGDTPGGVNFYTRRKRTFSTK
jgi:hypothetical protein